MLTIALALGVWVTSTAKNPMDDSDRFAATAVSSDSHMRMTVFCRIEPDRAIDPQYEPWLHVQINVTAIFDYDSEDHGTVQFRFDRDPLITKPGRVRAGTRDTVVFAHERGRELVQMFKGKRTLFVNPDLYSKVFIESFDVSSFPFDFFPAPCLQ